MTLIFPILTFFAGKMTSQSWRQILLLALRDILCRFLNDLVTQISKLKKIMKYVDPLKDITFRNLNFVTKNNLRGIRIGIEPIWEINPLTPSPSLATTQGLKKNS